MLLNTVFIGVGKMGSVALTSLQQIKDDLRKREIQFRLLALIEANPKLKDRLELLAAGFDPRPRVLFVDRKKPDSLADLLAGIYKGDVRESKILIYDASPSQRHFFNLSDVSKNLQFCTYFGEKPLVTDWNQCGALNSLQQRFYCDFVETESLVCLTLQNLMQQTAAKILKMTFWRANSVGLAKLFDPHRRVGVSGGALSDKAIHDISVTLALFGNENLRYLDSRVTRAEHHSFLPTTNLYTTKPSFLSGKDTTMNGISPADESGKVWNADAAGCARVNWLLTNSREVAIDYFFSWIGVDVLDELSHNVQSQRLSAVLSEAGLNSKSVISTTTEYIDMFRDYIGQEVRLVKIDLDIRGIRQTYIGNFLARGNIEPFVWDATHRRMIPLIPQPHYENSLARVFEKVICSCALGAPAPFLENEAVHKAHETLLKVRQKLLARSFNVDDEWEKAKQAVGMQLLNKYASKVQSVNVP